MSTNKPSTIMFATFLPLSTIKLYLMTSYPTTIRQTGLYAMKLDTPSANRSIDGGLIFCLCSVIE